MNHDNQENRPRIGPFRYVVLGLAGLLVLSLGFALIPADPPVPPPPSFTEQARAAAFDEAMELRAAGLQLGTGAGGGVASASTQPAVDRIVSLLTFQARALLAPDAPADGAPTNAAPPNAAPTNVDTTNGAADSSTPPFAPSAPPATPSAASMTVPELAAALAASGSKRLKDAETADGGMARLLAGAGTAQVLAARGLAAAAGAPDPSPAVPEIPDPEIPVRGTSTVPAPESSPASGTPGTAPAQTACAAPASGAAPAASDTAPSATAAALPAGPGPVLAAAAAAEHEAVYAYQAAVVRLPPEAAGPASDFLRGHQELAEDAEVLTRHACGHLPPQQPGYVLTPAFLADPAAGLARLEEGSLAVLGDAVATTGGTSRAWALAALQAAAARALHWGGDPGFLPGLALDPADLPGLPGATSPSPNEAARPATSPATDGP